MAGSQQRNANNGTPTANKSSHLIAVVTGGVRGLGKSIVLKLLSEGFLVVRGQRSNPSELVPSQQLSNVRDLRLDLANHNSVRNFSQLLLDELPYIDVLVNNAAICLEDPADVEGASHHWYSVMDVNFFAPMYLTERLLPLLQKSPRFPRVINISSGDGELLWFGEPLRSKLEQLSVCESVSDLRKKMGSILNDITTGAFSLPIQDLIFNGQSAYKLSKAALNAYTRLPVHRGRGLQNANISFLSVCPGDVDTDMADNCASLISTDEAVSRLSALLNVDLPCATGIFMRQGKEIPW